MVWFKVDDKAHSNSKIRKVIAEAPSALSLWTVAGSWSSDNLTDGFVPDHQLPWLMPVGGEEMARALVNARLWRRVRGGYQFHEWEEDGDGTKRNPTRADVETERRKKAEAGRIGGLSSGKKRASKNRAGEISTGLESDRRTLDDSTEHTTASGKTRSKAEARASAPATARAIGLLEPPTRPDPTYKGGTGLSVTHGRDGIEPLRPASRCKEHLNDPNPPACGRCADARKVRARWDATDAVIAADRRRTAPQCPDHRGQPAATCGLCRAEKLAGDQP